ncbi:hypothetical protein J2Z18_001495 [Paenibacillus lactis]|uniref:Uncharacterized protein n=1 Tax=Paenibacillus lactis TaxID=228574 RepID=A0ABS4F837_9BACL|nr:hypothetical protein [Paenibacillus lactis]
MKINEAWTWSLICLLFIAAAVTTAYFLIPAPGA